MPNWQLGFRRVSKCVCVFIEADVSAPFGSGGEGPKKRGRKPKVVLQQDQHGSGSEM